MKIKDLKKILESFDDEDKVMISMITADNCCELFEVNNIHHNADAMHIDILEEKNDQMV